MEGEAGSAAPRRVRIDLGGAGFGNGAFIETIGDTAVVYYPGEEDPQVGRAFQPNVSAMSGWKARPTFLPTQYVTGIDSADDLVKIFVAVQQTGATKGILFTGPVTSPTDLIRYRHFARVGGSRYGGKVTQLGEDTFRLDFDDWPILG
jgi:hypothetical protein